MIVLGSFDFSRIPAPLQKRILGMVSEGTGLVLVPPLNPPAAITQVSDAGRTAISSGVPWAALCDLYPKANLDPRRLSEKVVQAYTHGKGRVVILRWQDITASSSPEFGIAPHTAGAVVDRQYEHRYNYYLSLVGKAIHWAGGRESKVQWTELPAEGREHQTQDWPAKGVAVQLKWTGNDGQAVEMRAVLRDTSGRIESQQDRNVRLSTGVNSLLITLPAPPAGHHYLDLTALVDGKVENWAGISLRVAGPEEIVAMETDRRHFHRGDSVTGKVRFRGVISHAATLAVRAIDTYGREYARSNHVVEAGTAEARFELAITGPTSLASYIEADLVRNGRLLSQGETVIYVPKLRDCEFLSMAWTQIAPPNTMVGLIANRRLREAGFNAVYRWAYGGDFHNEAMADVMPVEYCTRLTMEADSRGWATLGLKAQYGIDNQSLANPEVQKAG